MWRLKRYTFPACTMVDMHELHTSVRRVCAGVSITLLFAMTRWIRIPQHGGRTSVDPFTVLCAICPVPCLTAVWSTAATYAATEKSTWVTHSVCCLSLEKIVGDRSTRPHTGLHSCTPALAKRFGLHPRECSVQRRLVTYSVLAPAVSCAFIVSFLAPGPLEMG
jgi:hypothetical protein